MPITSNTGGVLHELDIVTSNVRGVLHELDVVHSNVGGVLHEIHSGFKPPESIVLYEYWEKSDSSIGKSSKSATISNNTILFGDETSYSTLKTAAGIVSYPTIEEDYTKKWLELEFTAQSKMTVELSLRDREGGSHYSNKWYGYVTRTKVTGVPKYNSSESILSFTSGVATKKISLQKGETLYLRFMGYGEVGDRDPTTEEWTYYNEYNILYFIKLVFSK